MTLTKRLLYITPFLIAAYFFLRKQLADNDCTGLFDLVISLFQILCCIVTFIIAIVTTIRKRQSENLKFEPISGIITFITLVLVLLGGLAPTLFESPTYILAYNEQHSKFPGGQELKFKFNGRVVIYKNEVDFGCSETCDYKQSKDTFIIDSPREKYERGIISNKFLKQGHELIPLTNNNKIDTSKEAIKFVIDQIK